MTINKETQNDQKIYGPAMRICLFAPEARFSTNRSTILQTLMIFHKKLAKFMPAIMLCIASRGHKTWKTQCLHRLRVEIGPPMPQTHFKMRRCCADLMFCSGGTFFYKSMNNFTKSDDFSSNSLNSCQPSCFALLREATKREKLNVCTDWVLKLPQPCHKPISK